MSKSAKIKTKNTNVALTPWNPQTEPARTVKRILKELTPAKDVFINNTMSDLGLSAEIVQTEMNSEFFEDSAKSLSEEQCGPNVTAGQLVLEIHELQ